jgi:hypothetical protein
MFDFKVKIAMVATILLLATLVMNVAPSGTRRIEKTLEAAGFSVSHAETTSTRPGKISMTGLSLDPDGFSMMGDVSMTGGPLFPVFGSPARIRVENMQLTGEWNEEQGLGFAGWSLPRNMPALNLSRLQRVILEKGVIDLDTPAGAIRLELEGESARHPDNPALQIFNARLTGTQHQLIIDSQIKGSWTNDQAPAKDNAPKGFVIESEIREGRLNLEHLTVTRASGWITLESNDKSPWPGLSGQIQAGQIARDNLKLQNVSMTLDGPVTSPHAIIKGELGGFQSASLLLEIESRKNETYLQATIETQTAEDLIQVLTELRAQAETSPVLQETLMSLLITEGNIGRIKNDLKKDKYDSFSLEIEGPTHDLQGKVTGRKITGGIMQRQVYSLNPTIAAGSP